ncbi:MAG: glucans biosynthesis glucosyltransferase MdoH [Desulfoprunum sp.]|uniref:glucans biosynthesis glucosyltransferase MdoH n=1 Tax=Desulfoprunum sp. TaxID=2020866 RepID=UPI003C762188
MRKESAGILTADPPMHAAHPTPWRKRARLRRTILTLVVTSQCGIATYAMIRVLPYHGGDLLEICLALVFSLLFFGISVGSWFGIYGFFVRLGGGDRMSLLQRHPPHSLGDIPLARTAVIMPIYHEPIERTFGGLRAVYRSLEATGHLEYFDFFILSDSRDPEVWLAEQRAWYRLCRELGADGRLFYRRRQLNLKYKSGNIADFFRRWGRNYRYTLVLDADSLMGGETIVRMVRLMEVEPAVGILQSGPTLINARSLFARAHQFASHLYGPVFTAGLAALQLGEAAYWGHNAILRNEPFMRHCGLERLSGKGLFGGAIMSHDFVEAAYMVRGGYEVWLEPELGQSHEESPPTLVEDLTRDKRWAKGNLQHLWLIFFASRIRMAHRMAFLNGIMSYLASPLWLAFLLLSTLEASRLALSPINYFPARHSPFPAWPEWHPELALTLASNTFVLLFLPKLLAVLDVLRTRRTADFGGIVRLPVSLALETLISAILAPIRMVAHCRFVVEALCNLNLSWAGQNRTGETGWRPTLTSQLPGSIIACAWAGFAYRLDMMFFLWSLPVVIPLILAVPLSLLLGRVSLGQSLRKLKLLSVPAEMQGCALLADLHPLAVTGGGWQGLTAFEEAVIDPALNKLHQFLGRRHRGGAGYDFLLQLRDVCLKEGPAALSPREIAMLARDRESLDWLHQAVWQADQGSYWSAFHERGRK